MNGRYRPQRRLRHEIFSLALVAIIPVALVGVFPFSALQALPSHPTSGDQALCAFVHLTPDEERQALVTARAAWQLDRPAARRVRADLFADALPPLPTRAVGEFGKRYRTNRPAPATYVPSPIPFTQAAPPPVTIAPQDDAGGTARAFAREALLKLD